MAKKFNIRNSTAEFLIFQLEGKENGIQVLYKDETIWATQKAIAELFDIGVPAISKHLKFPKWKQLPPTGKCTTPGFIILMPLFPLFDRFNTDSLLSFKPDSDS